MKRTYYFPFTVLIAALALSACEIGSSGNPTPNPIALMQTVVALQTQSALQTQAVLPVNTTTATQNPPTATLSATNTPQPTATRSIPCLDLDYIKDLTIPDNTVMKAGQSFVKTWQVQNVGSCTWNTNYALVFVSGTSMGGPARVKLTSAVGPGQTVDLSVTLTAPNTSGTYTGNWMLQADNGTNFGFGASSSDAWWVKIKVSEPGYFSDAVPVPLASVSYDLAANICNAAWTSSTGKLTLPCAGYTTKEYAWASVLMAPVLEGGDTDNERTMWIHPDDSSTGWIKAIYPAYAVQASDHFNAIIGCMNQSKTCNVTISLDYRTGGVTTNLGTWNEVNDGVYKTVDINLSALAGQTIEIILTVSSSAKTGEADAFLLVPSILPIP